ncbi:MAG: hypothetical protein AB8B80_12080 [Marinicellaceae bacterium]
MNSTHSQTTIRIGGVPEHFNLPWKLSIESGSLSQFNINASWTDFHSGTGAMVQSLNDGSIDVATLLTEGAISALSQNNCQFELFSFYTKTPLIWGVHSPANSNIKTPDDIKNATFVISRFGSGSHLMAFLLAESLGMNLEALQFKVINNLDGARELFKGGGDYVFLWEKFMTKPYVDNGEMQRITDFPTPWSCFVTCVRKTILESYKDKINLAMQSVLQTANELKCSPLALKIIARDYGLTTNDVNEWLKTIQWQTEVSLHEKTINAVKIKLKQLKLIA